MVSVTRTSSLYTAYSAKTRETFNGSKETYGESGFFPTIKTECISLETNLQFLCLYDVFCIDCVKPAFPR